VDLFKNVRWTAEYVPIKDTVADQIVVTALADLFHVGKVGDNYRTAQFIGLLTDDVLRDLSKARYSSRFDA